MEAVVAAAVAMATTTAVEVEGPGGRPAARWPHPPHAMQAPSCRSLPPAGVLFGVYGCRRSPWRLRWRGDPPAA